MKTTDKVFEEFEKIFDPDLTPFKQGMLGGKVNFTLDDPSKGLKIVVTTPVRYQGKDVYTLEKGLPVEFAVYHHETKCLEFRNSRITAGWEHTARKKIETLRQLVNGTRKCQDCEVFTYPFEDSAPQGKPGSTHFVWYKCPKCNIRMETPWGKGLKTAVSHYLKRHQ